MAELHMSIDREVSVSIIPQVRKLMMYKLSEEEFDRYVDPKRMVTQQWT